ncbi:MAG: sodium:solute symporter family transporter, partial [Planctomycetota bacterium]
MATLDVLIILAFVAHALYQGFSARRVASQNLEEYFLAGRSLPGWKAGLSMAATQFAADTPLFVTGLVATAGIFYLWRPFWIFALAFLLLGFVLSSSWRRAGVLTDAELTEIRYGHGPAATLRGLKAVYFGVIVNCAILAMVLIAATRIAEPFLLWDVWLPAALFDPVVDLVRAIGVPLIPTTETADGTFILDTVAWTSVPFEQAGDTVWVLSARNLLSILAIVAVTTLYSTTGGLRSVVATDIVQLGIMLLGTIIFAWFVLAEVGGLGALTDQIRASYPEDGSAGLTANQILGFTPSQAKGISLALMATMLVQWLVHMYADGTGYLAQRTMACRTDEDAKQASIIFTFVQVVGRSLIWLPIALGVLILFPPAAGLPAELLNADREATYVRGMTDLLPAGALGLLLTGMLAALASTVDTHLNWGSSYLTNDIV